MHVLDHSIKELILESLPFDKISNAYFLNDDTPATIEKAGDDVRLFLPAMDTPDRVIVLEMH